MLIENCNFNGNTGFGNACFASLDVFQCSDVSIIGCSILDTIVTGVNAAAGVNNAINVEYINQLVIEDCIMQNIVAQDSLVSGIRYSGSSNDNLVIRNCTVQNLNFFPDNQRGDRDLSTRW